MTTYVEQTRRVRRRRRRLRQHIHVGTWVTYTDRSKAWFPAAGVR